MTTPSITTRVPLPKACAQHLDTAYTHAKALLLAHGDPVLTLRLLGGGDAVCDVWVQQMWKHAQQGEAQKTLESCRGWYKSLAAAVQQQKGA